MQFFAGPLSNAGRNLRQVFDSSVCWAWVVLVLAIQSLIALLGGVDRLGSWFETFGLSRDEFISGKVWQIFSYGLLHGSWWHVGFNAAFVLLVGSRIEHMAGRAVIAWVTFLGVIGGGVCHLLIGSGLLVGLSGGCVALLLLLTTLSPQSRMFPLPVSGRSLGLGILWAEGILALIDPALGLPGLSVVGRTLAGNGLGSWFQLGHACHLGGGLVGWLYGRWILRPRVTLEMLRRERSRREAE